MPRRKVSFSNGEGGGGERGPRSVRDEGSRSVSAPRHWKRDNHHSSLSPSPPRSSSVSRPGSPILPCSNPCFPLFEKEEIRRRRADFCQLRPSAFIADPPFTKRRMDVSLVPSRRGGREIFFFRDSIDRLNLKNNLLYYKRGSMKINNPCWWNFYEFLRVEEKIYIDGWWSIWE